MKTTLIRFYNKHAFTHNYILGFRMNKKIYFVTVDAKELDFVTKLDKASRGAGYSLRFKPDKAQKALLLSYGAQALCSAEYFEEVVADSKYNRGEVFEKMVTEQMFGQVWEKDNVPYTDGGDIEEVDGTAYQVKFEKATFTNEKSMSIMRK
jgi:hypothetical protein